MAAPPRLRAAAVFGAAALLFALAWALAPDLTVGRTGVHDGFYPLLWIGGFGVPVAALVGALAGPRIAGLVRPRRGAAAGLAVTVAAFVLGVLLVALVAMRPGGLFGHVEASNPGGREFSPAFIFQSVWPDAVLLLLLPALPFGAAAGAALVWLRRRGAAHSDA